MQSIVQPIGIAGWLNDDAAVIVYDNYDLWKLDLEGRYTPKNLTQGYGRRNNIKLRGVADLSSHDGTFSDAKIYSNRDTLLLSSFNTQTKSNGFYDANLMGVDTPKMLTIMGLFTVTPAVLR